MPYNMIFRNKVNNQFLEARQGNRPTLEEMYEESKLYKAWAEFHYRCEVSFVIELINEKTDSI